jgi:hypothetical protein
MVSTIDPKTRDAHTYLGILALQQADLSRAEREFESELAMDPNHPLAMAELGGLLPAEKVVGGLRSLRSIEDYDSETVVHAL